MRKLRHLLPALGILLLASAVYAAPRLLELAQDAPAATTSAYSLHNPNIRGPDGRLVPSKLTTDPQIGEITIDDGTGVTLTTPTAAVVKSATLSLAGAVRGSVVVDGPNGTITVKKPGLYRVAFCAGDGVGANTATVTLAAFENAAGGGAAAVSPAIEAIGITLTAQPWLPACASGFVSVKAEDAANAAFVVFDVRATASTGNLTFKRFRFSVTKVDELDPATP